ncbi:hypothetical protein [Zestomonas thermotolerans]|uniref:hypothetical protein n=1 Tax=Zestomonas thermotolerans TaxID=157784 RepID=UPI000480DF5A|nr:hypothetical protein [Pseudomonas thermotolerans]
MKVHAFAALLLASLSAGAFALPAEPSQPPHAQEAADDTLLARGDGFERTGGKADRQAQPADHSLDLARDGWKRLGSHGNRSV